MTSEEFSARCAKHDWYYEMTDDAHVWRRGLADRKELQALADGDPNLSEIWQWWLEHHDDPTLKLPEGTN